MTDEQRKQIQEQATYYVTYQESFAFEDGAEFGLTLSDNRVKELESVTIQLYNACAEFVRKCECGEARSKRSYVQMKAAIENADKMNILTPADNEDNQARN